MPKAKIMGLGLCVVDHLYLVDRLDPSEIRTRFTERLVLTGGMTGTALAQAATLGCDTRVMSWLGDDSDGRFIRKSLRAFGVKTAQLLLSPQSATTVALVLVERRSGERRFIVADRRALERAAPNFDLTQIDHNTVLMVDGHFPVQALRAVRRARDVGARVIGDFHHPSPQIRKLLPYVDYPIVPLEFADGISNRDPQRALCELVDDYGGTPIITLGKDGGIYWDAGRVRRYRARRVRICDTTGAGDVFHGAFAAGLLRGMSLPHIVNLAAHAASLCCTALGGTGRLMTREEFLAAESP